MKKIAILSPIAWRTPPQHYGPWELVASLISEGLVHRGWDVTLFATANSITSGTLHSVCQIPYEEDKEVDAKVWECLHISELFEKAHEFDLIHNHYDFLPLTYSSFVDTPIVTTIHGFSSKKILPVYKKYNNSTHYVSISNSDRADELDYIATVYHGITLNQFTFQKAHGDYLLFFGRFHKDKGAKEAIEIARASGKKLLMVGIIQDHAYYDRYVKPYIDGEKIQYLGTADAKLRDELLGGAYALLHPINFDEPFGLSVVESFACGTPVIAFNRGSMPELIENGKTGFLVSSVSEAIDTVDKVEALSRRECREVAVKRFSEDIMVEEYIKVYEKILRSR